MPALALPTHEAALPVSGLAVGISQEVVLCRSAAYAMPAIYGSH